MGIYILKNKTRIKGLWHLRISTGGPWCGRQSLPLMKVLGGCVWRRLHPHPRSLFPSWGHLQTRSLPAGFRSSCGSRISPKDPALLSVIFAKHMSQLVSLEQREILLVGPQPQSCSLPQRTVKPSEAEQTVSNPILLNRCWGSCPRAPPTFLSFIVYFMRLICCVIC